MINKLTATELFMPALSVNVEIFVCVCVEGGEGGGEDIMQMIVVEVPAGDVTVINADDGDEK